MQPSPPPSRRASLLAREEYVEQAYLFRTLGERIRAQIPTQELLYSLRDELLATTRLRMAVDFMAAELKLVGVFSTAMRKLGHYFTAFQTFVVEEAEAEGGRFDFLLALEVLHKEASHRAEGPAPQGVFLYQFEALCRNRLGYDRGLAAMAADPIFDDGWREWIETVRRQIGFFDLADLVYVRSEHYRATRRRSGLPEDEGKPVLFGEKEGRIALSSRRKDPLLFFAALQRHLGYPAVPRQQPAEDSRHQVYGLMRRLERVEGRLRLIEEELKGGIDLRRFYGPPPAAADQ
jgi:hypothetical protein